MLTTTASLRARAVGVDGAQPRVEPRGIEVGQRDDLSRHAQRGLRADVLDARGDLGLVALAAQLGAPGVEEVAGHEVQEVLPRALGAPVAKARELLLEVLVLPALDEGDELALVLAGQSGDEVRERVRVRGDEVQRRVAEPALVEVGAHGRPPAPRHALVADLRPAEHAHAHRLALVGDRLHVLLEARAPRVGQPRPVVGGAPEGRGAGLGRRALARRPAGGEHAPADLVPLDLVGDQRRDEVVDVGLRGEQDGEHLVAAVVPAPAARGRLDRVPLLERPDAGAAEERRLLAHDDDLDADHRLGQAPDRVDEGAEVDLVALGQRVQRGAHRHVRGLEHAQARLAAGAQQRGVRALVELDLVGEVRRGDVRRRGRRDAEAGDGHAIP